MFNFSDEPPRKTNKPPSSPPPSSFSSLPNELIIEILARNPRRYYPILSCVCKNFSNLIRSPDFRKTRSLLGHDSLYICFLDESNQSRNWFTLRQIENNPNQNHFTSIDFPSPRTLKYSSVIAIGPEIFFICGRGRSYFHSSSFFIFDSRSHKFRLGSNMQVERLSNSAGLVGGKIYVIGGHRGNKIEAEMYDLKKRIWEVAPNPKISSDSWNCSAVNVSLDRKVYALSMFYGLSCYDTRDGSCVNFVLPDEKWWESGVCVIENVLYVYFAEFGLMWFDVKVKGWRVVDGLSRLNRVKSVGMAEYYGRLAFLWKESGVVKGETKEIWCRMIALEKSGGRICGIAEPSQLLGIVPRNYRLLHCLSVSN